MSKKLKHAKERVIDTREIISSSPEEELDITLRLYLCMFFEQVLCDENEIKKGERTRSEKVDCDRSKTFAIVSIERALREAKKREITPPAQLFKSLGLRRLGNDISGYSIKLEESNPDEWFQVLNDALLAAGVSPGRFFFLVPLEVCACSMQNPVFRAMLPPKEVVNNFFLERRLTYGTTNPAVGREMMPHTWNAEYDERNLAPLLLSFIGIHVEESGRFVQESFFPEPDILLLRMLTQTKRQRDQYISMCHVAEDFSITRRMFDMAEQQNNQFNKQQQLVARKALDRILRSMHDTMNVDSDDASSLQSISRLRQQIGENVERIVEKEAFETKEHNARKALVGTETALRQRLLDACSQHPVK